MDEDFEIDVENKDFISNPRSPSKTPPHSIQINLININNNNQINSQSPPKNNHSPNYSSNSQIVLKLNLNSQNSNNNNIKRLASEISSEDEEIKNNFLLEDNN